MRNRVTRIGILMMALVLAVGAMGAGFASFTDTLFVEGYIDTANVDYEVEELSGTWVYKLIDSSRWVDYQKYPVDGDPGPPEPPEPVLEFVSSANSSWDPDTSMVTMNYNNIYPGVDFCADFVIHYTGSIPAHVSLDPIVWAGTDLSEYLTVSAYKVPCDENGVTNGDTVAFFEDGDIQLHNCECLEVVFCLNIPQDNELQGDGNPTGGVTWEGSFSTKLNLFQWNEATSDCIEVLKEIDNLPEDQVYLSLADNSEFQTDDDGYFMATFSDNGSGIPDWLLLGNDWDAYCCEYEPADLKALPVMLESSLEAPYNSNPAWNKINWILNQPALMAQDYGDNKTVKFGAHTALAGSPAQVAFWQLLFGNVSNPDQAAQDIIDLANANGAGFIPGPGQFAAVICEDGDTYQTVFIVVDP